MQAVGLVSREAEQLQRRGIRQVRVFDDEQQRLPLPAPAAPPAPPPSFLALSLWCQGECRVTVWQGRDSREVNSGTMSSREPYCSRAPLSLLSFCGGVSSRCNCNVRWNRSITGYSALF